MDDLKAKIDKLPVWAKEHIAHLKALSEPQLSEIVRLRQKVEQLERIKRDQQSRIDAMVAMFQCAAKGGNEVAATVQRIVEDWIITDDE